MKKILIFCFLIFILTCNVYSARMCAEWEPALGTLIRYPIGIPVSLVIEIAEDDTVYTLVKDEYEKDQAEYYFQTSGVNIEHCKWIYADTYSHWTRDWGPQIRFKDGEAEVVDPLFDGYPWVPGGTKDWSIDDAVNQQFALQMGLNCIDFPGYLTGGNVMYDGHGTAFSTEQMVNENLSLMDTTQFFSYTTDLLGIDKYYITPNTENYGIQHIDCSAKLLNEETILVKQLPVSHPEYNRIENFCNSLVGLQNCFNRDYEIIRIFCGIYDYYNMYAAAYTNSLILNKKVLVPMFNIDSDSSALNVYESSLPGYEVIGIDYSQWYYYDALHCRTKNIFDPKMLRLSHCPLDSLVEEEDNYEISVFIDDRSETGLIESQLKLNWRLEGSSEWTELLLLPTIEENIYKNYIPNQGVGEVIQYYLSAADSSGRVESLPRTSPEAYYEFEIIENNQVQEEFSVCNILYQNRPNPFKFTTSIKFYLAKSSLIKLNIYNINGQKVKTLLNVSKEAGEHIVIWNGKNNKDKKVSNGIYFYKLINNNLVYTKRLLLMK